MLYSKCNNARFVHKMGGVFVKKRIFSWLLCAAMLLSLMPTGIFALAEDVAAEAADIVIEKYDSTSGAVMGESLYNWQLRAKRYSNYLVKSFNLHN